MPCCGSMLQISIRNLWIQSVKSSLMPLCFGHGFPVHTSMKGFGQIANFTGKDSFIRLHIGGRSNYCNYSNHGKYSCESLEWCQDLKLLRMQRHRNLSFGRKLRSALSHFASFVVASVQKALEELVSGWLSTRILIEFADIQSRQNFPAYFTHATWPCSRREIHNWFLPHKNRSGHVDLFSIYQSLWFETHPNRHQCQQWHAWRPAEILWDFVFQDSRIESLGFAMVRDGKY